jgi:predicted dienelactone hydrolase
LNRSKCIDAPGFDRAAFHQGFNAAVLTFFRKHLQ